jgi:phage terminase small subunit
VTTKQELFIDNYVANGFNATQAAKDAGYSLKTAYSIGQNLLKNVEISKAINSKIREILSDVDKAAFDIIKDLDEIREADIGDYVNIEEIVDPETGSKIQRAVFKPTENLNTKVISEIAETQSGGLRIKMYDRLKATELKGRYLSMWSDTLNVVRDNAGSADQLSREERKKRIMELSRKMDIEKDAD